MRCKKVRVALAMVLLPAFSTFARSQNSPTPPVKAIPEAILLWEMGAPRATGDSLKTSRRSTPFCQIPPRTPGRPSSSAREAVIKPAASILKAS
jgi:hypothetical protein